jgi:glycosyltransferase involved in cell wall biosynthesis
MPAPEELRQYVKHRFTTQRMADEYLELYRRDNYEYKKGSTCPMFILNKSKLLRIAQVSPDYYPVPPPNYGGIERVIYDLTEELVEMGHEVYLFAHGRQ